MKRAFTLIELLIVVAIIAILAAIAVPNFLEAQTSAKVSRVAADLRSVSLALEAYGVDHAKYPPTAELPNDYPNSPFNTIGRGWMAYAGRLSTPIAYMTTVPLDFFRAPDPAPNPYIGPGNTFYEYWIIEDLFGSFPGAYELFPPSTAYILWSWGPDGDADRDGGDRLNIDVFYDPTNGTVSDGNMFRPGPGGRTLNS